MTKERLDRALVNRGLVESRSRAQALILAGQVLVNRQRELKAGRMVEAADTVELVSPMPYVSRGGVKLAAALEAFEVNPTGWQVVDIGASTGGFTDCWLKHGARHVWAVDVGYGQLHWQLRQDPRVSVYERTNARYITRDQLGLEDGADAGSVDVSFIGLRLILEPLRNLVKTQGLVIVLIKPQFEAGPTAVGKGGVVRDPAVHRQVLYRVLEDAAGLGWAPEGLIASPIRGPEGNIEFLAALRLDGDPRPLPIEDVVERAWQGEGAHG